MNENEVGSNKPALTREHAMELLQGMIRCFE